MNIILHRNDRNINQIDTRDVIIFRSNFRYYKYSIDNRYYHILMDTNFTIHIILYTCAH